MKKSRIIIITVIVTLVIVSVIGIVYKVKTSASRKPTIVRMDKAQRGELIEFVSAPGEIEPRINVEMSAKVSARITELPYEEGDIVTKGNPKANPPIPASVLVRLDDNDLQSRLLSAEASYAAQEAQIEVEKARISSQQASLVGLDASLQQAQRDLERQKGLLESQDISQATYDQSKLRFDELKSQYNSTKHTLNAANLNLLVMQHNLEAAGAGVTQAKEALSYTTITSPIDGVITRINAEVGEVVIFGTMNNPGTVILEVADLSTMLLVAQVDEADVGKLAVGQKAKVFVQTFPDKEFKGVVDLIALTHRISQSTATKYFRTEILLEGDVKKLFSGLTAHVDIETIKHENVLNVPSHAVLGRPIDDLPLKIREDNPEVDKEKTFTPVVYRHIDGKAVVTPVKIGPSNLTHTVILSGITEDDTIIVGPYKELESLSHDKKVRDEREVEAEKEKKKKKTDGPKAGADTNDTGDANSVK
ncbi:MAG: efflux RND transporter periplasmic adaptor subunit [Planctomycetes bacterium]|nr:efflux RND transporter periplasmic adaptor subunit [Planctomycetota bacterium]MBL7147125.1 efflux RND transporter periplasmic adaptor subunit [Phycisphaerae bacterium]